MRDRKFKEPTPKSAAERHTIEFTVKTLQILGKEKIFPKRARWQGVYEMARIVQRVHTCVMFANGIEVESHKLMVDRHEAQTLALAWMYALNSKMSLAIDIFELNANALGDWADKYDEAWRCIKGWRNKDLKRYAAKYGDLTAEETERITNAARSILDDIMDNSDGLF